MSLDRHCCEERALRRAGDASCGCGPHAACCRIITSVRAITPHVVEDVDVVIVGLSAGLDALAPIKKARRDLPVIQIGPPGDAPRAVAAIRGGAMDYLASDGTEPIRSLPLAIEKCLVHQGIRQENERLQRDLGESLDALAEKNEQLETVIHQLEAMARTDELTGLANRRWLNLTLEGSWAEASRHDLPLACLMIDLDGFKPLNDRMGHQRGDELLRLVGRVIQANCRAVDCSARYGGDEFCILMPHTQPADAARVAQRILHEFRIVAADLPDDEPRIGMSMGLAHNRLSRPSNAEQLVSFADEALYGAKSAGKDCIMSYGPNGVFDPTAPAALRDAVVIENV
jgi:two-component system chemotaxis family response regulator WspR